MSDKMDNIERLYKNYDILNDAENKSLVSECFNIYTCSAFLAIVFVFTSKSLTVLVVNITI